MSSRPTLEKICILWKGSFFPQSLLTCTLLQLSSVALPGYTISKSSWRPKRMFKTTEGIKPLSNARSSFYHFGFVRVCLCVCVDFFLNSSLSYCLYCHLCSTTVFQTYRAFTEFHLAKSSPHMILYRAHY